MNRTRKHRIVAWAICQGLMGGALITGRLAMVIPFCVLHRLGSAPPRLIEIAIALWTFAAGVVIAEVAG